MVMLILNLRKFSFGAKAYFHIYDVVVELIFLFSHYGYDDSRDAGTSLRTHSILAFYGDAHLEFTQIFFLSHIYAIFSWF